MPPLSRNTDRWTVVALTVAVHGALLFAFLQMRPTPLAREEMQWGLRAVHPHYIVQNFFGAPHAPAGAPMPTAAPRAAASPSPALPTAAPATPHAEIAAAAAETAMTAPAVEAAPPIPETLKESNLLLQARRDAGKADRAIRDAHPTHFASQANTAQTRMEKRFDEAAAAAPPKIYEAPKIEVLADAGPYGRKRYKVTTANGVYCITYETNHAPDGMDIKHGVKSKVTNCPVEF